MFNFSPQQGQLTFFNDVDRTEHVFTLTGVGEQSLPVDHIKLRCPVGKTTHTQLNVPNYSQKTQYLKVQAHMYCTTADTGGNMRK